MPEPYETKSDLAETTINEAYRVIFASSWFAPDTLKKYLAALRDWQEGQVAVFIEGQPIERQQIISSLKQFLTSLPPQRQQALADQGLTEVSLLAAEPGSLNLLEATIDEVAGLAPEIPPRQHPR